MEHKVLIGGSGGQGVMLLGTMLAIAAINENRQCTCLPAYGPEMRGGTANCTVIVSDEPVLTPSPDSVQTVIVMNEPSYKKFVDQVPEGGLLIVNSSITNNVVTEGVNYEVLQVPCNDIAAELGDKAGKCANMVAAGAYIAKTGAITVEGAEKTLADYFGAKKPAAVELNVKAILRGIDYVKNLK